MKKFMTLLAVAASLAVFSAADVQARDSHHHSSRRHSHNCGSCGGSVYRELVRVGYDCHGHPIYSWRTVSHHCSSHHGHSHGSHHHHGSSGHISFPGFHIDFGR